ncbi:hypothetical protein MNBD_NITROSPIRAE03-1550, partial [hydrothermal vent metagenome]
NNQYRIQIKENPKKKSEKAAGKKVVRKKRGDT